MFMLLFLLLVFVFCLLGVSAGVLTGLLPGFHVNNVAVILLSVSSGIAPFFGFLSGYGFSSETVFILISVFILSCSISHTFLDCIPSTFLGAPDPDTALSVLPAHSLLMEGRGYEAVSLSAIGSYGAILFCFLLFFPLRFVIGTPLEGYNLLKEIMVFVLIAVSILMIATEKGRIIVHKKEKNGWFPSIMGMLFAVFVFFLSGVFGLIILDMNMSSPVGLSSSVLFPALAGLFGMPTLIASLKSKPVIPRQNISEPVFDKFGKKPSFLSIVSGSVMGVLVSIVPGITSAVGTVLAMNVRGESDKKQTIITLSAVNTACAFFIVIVMFIILRARSGAALAMMNLITVSEWKDVSPPWVLFYLLIAILFAGFLSYLLTLKIGKSFAKSFDKIPYLLMIKSTILLVTLLVFLFTGFIGVLVLFIATFIGLLPVEWGIRRSHCMGVLLIPVILYFL